MGFTHHPGALPFATIRDRKWANRLTLGENIEIHGEHGCTMLPIAAQVTNVVDYKRAPPAHLAPVYAGKPLCVVWLAAPDDEWVKQGESWYLASTLTQPVV